jgi:dynein heavy chain
MLTILSRTLSSAGQRHFVHRIYPKAISPSQLYGWFLADTSQWHDGILSSLWRSRAVKTDESVSWIVLDGPVDPVWAEGLTAVVEEKVGSHSLTN